MNILYCGDSNIEKGLIISILSLMKNVKEELNIIVMTMSLETPEKKYLPVGQKTIDYLDGRLKQQNEKSAIRLVDVTERFAREVPKVNMETRFTPYCMLRLFADEIDDLPDNILYLDNDVVCRKDFSDFYYQDLENYELAGVLDYYGSWFFRRNIFKRDYLNSGVLLLNMKKIKETGLFAKCRTMCINKKMFMPDQSALNKLANKKVIKKRKYNEQRKLHDDTVLQHFTTSFRFLPYIHTVTIKPWQIDLVHEQLKLHEYDDILNEYLIIAGSLGI